MRLIRILSQKQKVHLLADGADDNPITACGIDLRFGFTSFKIFDGDKSEITCMSCKKRGRKSG
jgi:hypothetical protein